MSKNVVTLKSGTEVTDKSLKVAPFGISCMVSYQCSLVTLSLKRTVFEIFNLSRNQNDGAFRWWKKFSDRFSRFDTIPECDGQPPSQPATQPDTLPQLLPRLLRRAGKNQQLYICKSPPRQLIPQNSYNFRYSAVVELKEFLPPLPTVVNIPLHNSWIGDAGPLGMWMTPEICLLSCCSHFSSTCVT